ncbi:hypothetical protein WISP_110401 [Willisornis vidua]|uniref:Uncharacterized protein n=1 Tax=Willisornis vidua TaxID=1566151 RepID=A0ABQ9D1G1_9PASS|nr:hypothetical protein WISP_110401 [Willisornis vidua]
MQSKGTGAVAFFASGHSPMENNGRLKALIEGCLSNSLQKITLQRLLKEKLSVMKNNGFLEDDLNQMIFKVPTNSTHSKSTSQILTYELYEAY